MELGLVLESLSDSELNIISGEVSNNTRLESIRNQLENKGNKEDGELTFTRLQLTNGVVNELSRRLLVRDSDISNQYKRK